MATASTELIRAMQSLIKAERLYFDRDLKLATNHLIAASLHCQSAIKAIKQEASE